jgi:hypothetical protein
MHALGGALVAKGQRHPQNIPKITPSIKINANAQAITADVLVTGIGSRK